MNQARRLTTLLISCIALASCGSGEGSFYVPLKDPDTLYTFDVFDPPTLDPHRSWGVADGRLIGLIFCNLVRFNRDAEIIPDLATSWEISEDGRTYAFHLHPDAKFSNGAPITSADVVYSFERALHPDTAAANKWALDPIESMNAPDAHTVELTLTEPFAPFLGQLAMPVGSILPREVIERYEAEGINFDVNPVGGGPWKLIEWKHDQYISLERNELFWGEQPEMKRMVYRVIPSHFTAVAEFETGNLSVVEELPEAEIPRWTMDPNWAPYVAPAPKLNIDMILFNCSKPPLDRPEVRRALAALVDSEKVLQCVRFGAGIPAGGPIPSTLPGGAEERVPYPISRDEAARVLTDAGLMERQLRVVFPEREGFTRATGEVIQALWKRAGIDARVQQLEWATYRQALREGDFDAAYRSWYADYPDGDNFLYPLFHSSQKGSSNFTFLNDPAVDRAINATRTELDAERRVALLEEANQLIFNTAPALFLWHRTQYTVHHPHLKGYRPQLIFNGIRYLSEHVVVPDEEAA